MKNIKKIIGTLGYCLKYLRSNYIKIILIFILIVPIIWIYLDTVIFIESNRVSIKELNIYVNEYFSSYDKLYEDNSEYFMEFRNDTLESIVPTDMWDRYIKYPSNIEGVISKVHGVAIIYNYEEDSNIKYIKEIDDVIEYYIWPNMSPPEVYYSLEKIYVSKGEYIFDTEYSVRGLLEISPASKLIFTAPHNTSKGFIINNDAAIIINGELIIEDKMILKGYNHKMFWSRPQASLDVLSRFLFDCKDVLNQSDIREIENKYLSSIILEKILYGMKIAFYKYYPNYFYDHLNDLEKSGFNNEIIISQIWKDYTELQMYVEPTFIEKIIKNDYFRSYVLIIVGILVNELIRKTRAR